jgi:hypothetical protein
VHEPDKVKLINRLISDKPDVQSILIFSSTKKKVFEIVRGLKKHGHPAEGISSDLEQREREEVLSLYPVPTRGKLYLRFNEHWRLKDAELLISIYSMEGRKVHTSQQRSSALIELELGGHKPGMYIISIQADELVLQKQLILY